MATRETVWRIPALNLRRGREGSSNIVTHSMVYLPFALHASRRALPLRGMHACIEARVHSSVWSSNCHKHAWWNGTGTLCLVRWHFQDSPSVLFVFSGPSIRLFSVLHIYVLGALHARARGSLGGPISRHSHAGTTLASAHITETVVRCDSEAFLLSRRPFSATPSKGSFYQARATLFISAWRWRVACVRRKEIASWLDASEE